MTQAIVFGALQTPPAAAGEPLGTVELHLSGDEAELLDRIARLANRPMNKAAVDAIEFSRHCVELASKGRLVLRDTCASQQRDLYTGSALRFRHCEGAAREDERLFEAEGGVSFHIPSTVLSSIRRLEQVRFGLCPEDVVSRAIAFTWEAVSRLADEQASWKLGYMHEGNVIFEEFQFAEVIPFETARGYYRQILERLKGELRDGKRLVAGDLERVENICLSREVNDELKLAWLTDLDLASGADDAARKPFAYLLKTLALSSRDAIKFVGAQTQFVPTSFSASKGPGT